MLIEKVKQDLISWPDFNGVLGLYTGNTVQEGSAASLLLVYDDNRVIVH